MRSRLIAPALLGIAAAALVAAVPAAGKEGVKATLTTHIPLDAKPGARLEVGWTLAYVERGRRQPFGANGVFVRLRSASGAGAETGLAPMGAYPTGEYAASVVVPKGGIGDVEIGLRSWTSGPTGTRRGDMLFPITNDPLPGVARIVSPAAGHSGPTTWTVVAVAGLLSTLAVLAIAFVRRRTRGEKSRVSALRVPR